MKFVFIVLLIAALVILGPFLMIWSVNTLIIYSGLVPALSGTSAWAGPIAYNVWTWLAAILLGAIVSGNRK